MRGPDRARDRKSGGLRQCASGCSQDYGLANTLQDVKIAEGLEATRTPTAEPLDNHNPRCFVIQRTIVRFCARYARRQRPRSYSTFRLGRNSRFPIPANIHKQKGADSLKKGVGWMEYTRVVLERTTRTVYRIGQAIARANALTARIGIHPQRVFGPSVLGSPVGPKQHGLSVEAATPLRVAVFVLTFKVRST